MAATPEPPSYGNLAERLYSQLLGFRNLRQRFSLLPVATVLLVSLITNLVLNYRARSELYDSRRQLAQALAEGVAQHLANEVASVRDELSSWAAYIATWPSLRAKGSPELQGEFKVWLRSLGEPATSRFDLLTLAGQDGRVVAINDVSLSISAAQALARPVPLGTPLTGLVGEPNDTWLNPVWNAGLASNLPWRAIDQVNELYRRQRDGQKSPDDVVRSYQIVFAVPVPAAGGGKADHVLVAVASWAPFQRIIDEGEAQMGRAGLRTGYGFVLDKDGDRVIAHKLRAPAGAGPNLLGTSVSMDNDLPQVAEAARAATGEAFEYEFPPGNRKFAVFVPVDPETTRSDRAFDWSLAVGVDYSDIFAPLARLQNAFVWATVALTFAMLAVGVWMRRSLTLSVSEFAHLASEAAAGRFDLVRQTGSHDDISDLAAAMNSLFVSMRQKAEVEPVPNPYVVGTPVRSAEMFFGRHDDLRWVTDRLRQPGNELIVLYGQRRIGKTSLLQQLRRRGDGPPILPVFVDTHALLPSLRQDDDLYPALARAIGRDIRDALDQSSTTPVRGADDLIAMVLKINRSLPGQPLVLMFDEFEALEQKMLDGSLSSEASSFLAGLLETDCSISIIATGSHDGSRVGGPLWSTLAPKALGRRIGLLSQADGMRLVCEPIAGHVEFEHGTPQRILRLTGSHPYYTQTVCQRVVDLLNERHSRRVSHEVVRTVGEQLLNEPPLPLDDMWSGATMLHRWVMAELGRLLPDSESFVKADAILVNARFPPVAIVAELRRLTAAELLEESASGFRFPVDFIRMWIRKEQLWWTVAQAQEAIS